jgi:hypothetical protein
VEAEIVAFVDQTDSVLRPRKRSAVPSTATTRQPRQRGIGQCHPTHAIRCCPFTAFVARWMESLCGNPVDRMDDTMAEVGEERVEFGPDRLVDAAS